MKTVYNCWRPGKYDLCLNLDGKNGPQVVPPAYGLAGTNRIIETGDGDDLADCNCDVGVTRMGGHGTSVKPNFGVNRHQRKRRSDHGAAARAVAVSALAGRTSTTERELRCRSGGSRQTRLQLCRQLRDLLAGPNHTTDGALPPGRVLVPVQLLIATSRSSSRGCRPRPRRHRCPRRKALTVGATIVASARGAASGSARPVAGARWLGGQEPMPRHGMERSNADRSDGTRTFGCQQGRLADGRGGACVAHGAHPAAIMRPVAQAAVAGDLAGDAGGGRRQHAARQRPPSQGSARPAGAGLAPSRSRCWARCRSAARCTTA